jgi:glycosyltransferase involved in cell wall biosynthesis
MTRPRVSIGLPVYNADKYLDNAIRSLLDQDFEDFELIICDNASTDSTPDICTRYSSEDSRVKFFCNKANIGIAANHNRTFILSQGKYFKWAAYDDEYPSSMLSRFVDELDRSSGLVSLVYSQCIHIDEAGFSTGIASDHLDSKHPQPYRRFLSLLRNLQVYNSIYGLMPADLLRRTRLLGLYPRSDRVLLSELIMLGVFVEIHEPLLRIRKHPQRTFTAYQKAKDLRELFMPGQGNKTHLLSMNMRMEIELIRSSMMIPLPFSDRMLCIFAAALAPQWNSFRALGGRWKRRIIRKRD